MYRFYIFEKNNDVAAPPKIYELPNDTAALKEAKRTINGCAIEVWRYTKKIGLASIRLANSLVKLVIVRLTARHEAALRWYEKSVEAATHSKSMGR